VREEHERPLAALEALGIEPEDVDHVIVTPLMAYSAANLSLFPNAVYTISRKGWISRLAPEYGWVKVRGGDKPPLAQYRSPLDIYIPPEQFHYLLYERSRTSDEGELDRGSRCGGPGCTIEAPSRCRSVERASAASDVFYKNSRTPYPVSASYSVMQCSAHARARNHIIDPVGSRIAILGRIEPG
jgi:hypothetical protein